MVSPDEKLAQSHRHVGHCMAIAPLGLLDYHRQGQDREIIDASLEHLVSLGRGNWWGLTFPWMSFLLSRQGSGDAAGEELRLFWECFCSRNGLHLNGDFSKRGIVDYQLRPFTIEGNMGAACALQEMLLESYGGVVRVFPAVPQKWKSKEVAFEDLRVEGALLVSAKMVDGRLVSICLKAQRNGTFKIENKFETESLSSRCAGNSQVINCPIGEVFEVSLGTNESCLVSQGYVASG